MTNSNLRKATVSYFHHLQAVYKRQNDPGAKARAVAQATKSRRAIRKNRVGLCNWQLKLKLSELTLHRKHQGIERLHRTSIK